MRAIGIVLWGTVSSQLRRVRDDRDERGLTTIEIVVVLFILLAVAIFIGGLLYN